MSEQVYERTENGTVTHVSTREGLAEINHAMMDGKREVETMSSISRTDYAIEYKDGRKVRLVRVDAPAAEDPKEWTGTASNFSHLHRFDAELKALCNRRIRSRGAARRAGVLIGHDELRSRSEVESSEYAHLYTFCPRCEAK
jgi:hypothetical protein